MDSVAGKSVTQVQVGKHGGKQYVEWTQRQLSTFGGINLLFL